MDKDKNKDLTTEFSDTPAISMDILCRNSIELIQYARKIAVNRVNLVQLMTYYALGYWIVEEQQSGKNRAGYGKKVIAALSGTLNEEFGKGFSVDTLENARKFYLIYSDRISETVFRKFTEEKSDAMVYAYYEIGKMIAEEEQQGENRAAYGKQLLKELSAYLTEKFGKGYSKENLKLMRRFYIIYSQDQIG